MNYLILSIIFGLIPFFQLFIKGWLFFLISLILFIIFYHILKNRGKQAFSFLAATILGSEAFALLFGFTNFFILFYLLVVSGIFLVAANEEKKFDILKEHIKNNNFNFKDWNFYHLFFGRGEISSLEEIGKLISSTFAIGENHIAYSLKTPNGDYYNQIISKEDIESYNLYDIKGKQELYYAKMQDLFIPNKQIRTLHKPYLESFCLTILLKNGELISFYEEPDVLQKIIKNLDDL
ncbi:hypothetical protein SAMN02745164_00273 [Marinitoga hydrogenitolerans DSM 16785]|uniref:Uncharacterized protein n=1 Tax=Marinitoga hydrogenitolerans (strain DSM 16785 / JCM 12826 / AT1271) TaxID=1122195 RepID=A0A1M4SW80_MARH1|nr:hypothetical protein [Marinitoga hydrogenitolerans]SHE36287.1 hypothetical protein SAMN02745164_00273 [Marinitoga hydrogenitolerans DSM 16785]